VRAGRCLFQQGDRLARLNLLVSGLAQASVVAANGSSGLIAVRTPGSLLGAAAACLGVPQPVTITALTDCVVRPITLSDFEHVRARNPSVAAWLQEVLARQVNDYHAWSAAAALGRKRDLLEWLLADLFANASQRRPDGSARLLVPIGLSQLAQFLGVSRQWAYRLLEKLSNEDAIRRDPSGWLTAPASSRLLPPPSPDPNAGHDLG
jgi:CRP-like cAMP-binding protein